MIGIGLVGYGHWGPNLARNFAAVGARIVAISDRRADRLRMAQVDHPAAEMMPDWADLVGHSAISAVVVATPPSTHFGIAGKSLAAGKHVLVEKPLTTSSNDASRLVDLAAQRQLTLMVDHTYLYERSVQDIRRLIAQGSIGALSYYDGIRAGAPPAIRDGGVVWDLMAHDVAIMDHIFDRHPLAVGAHCADPADSPVDDAHCTLVFGGGLIGHVHASWRSPVKIRRTLIGGSRRTIVHDTLDRVAPIRLIDLSAPAVDDCEPDPASPASTETLATVARAFLDAVATGRRPLADGEAGLQAVRVLEIACASLARGGLFLRFPDGKPI